MFKSTSMTGVSMIVIVLSWLIQYFFGTSVDNEQLFIVVTKGIEFFGYAGAFYGQLRRKDISWFAFRRVQ